MTHHFRRLLNRISRNVCVLIGSLWVVYSVWWSWFRVGKKNLASLEGRLVGSEGASGARSERGKPGVKTRPRTRQPGATTTNEPLNFHPARAHATPPTPPAPRAKEKHAAGS